MSDLMRDEFEKGWGYTNEEQDCYFIPEINCYGSDRVNRAAEGKSIAWLYFQRGWKASRECLVIERQEDFTDGGSPSARILVSHHREIIGRWVESIEQSGAKVES